MIRHRAQERAVAPSRSHSGSSALSISSGDSDSDLFPSRFSSKGLFSLFGSKKRRRPRATKDVADSLLPTLLPATFSAATAPSADNHRGLARSNSGSRNNFLLGGNFYPGKDKSRRRHLQQQPIWYRMFCASTFRQVICGMVLLYVAWCYVLTPLGGWLFNFLATVNGGIAIRPGEASNARDNWLQYDFSLKVLSPPDEKFRHENLHSERARLQFGPDARNKLRLQLFENVVPKWYHRNDKTNSQDDGKEEQKPANSNQESGDAELSLNVEHHSDKKGDSTTPTKVTEAKSDQYPARTFKSIDEPSWAHSGCDGGLDDSDLKTTLVLQTSVNRVWILQETCLRWTDPIVVVAFVPHDSTMDSPQISCDNLTVILYKANEEESIPANYPVNRLRNVGLEAVTSSHVLIVDIDFVPSMGLAETIRSALKQEQVILADTSKRALVVPAFERLPPEPCETEQQCSKYLHSSHSFLPSTFAELQNCIFAKDCIVFQMNVNWEGHYSTHSDAWLKRKWFEDRAQSRFVTIPCFHSARYEPYVVLRWCPSGNTQKPVAPYYDERFHGYGKNKIQLVSHLRKSGYQFAILPEGFIVHNPHPESKTKNVWNDKDGSELHSLMDELYHGFVREVIGKYKDVHNSTVKLCPVAEEEKA